MNLPEKHRPQSWSEVVGQNRAVSGLLRLRDTTGLGGNAFWVSGKSGTGKTTIARLIAQEVAENAICITEIDADDLTTELIGEIRRNLKVRLARAWIINEAHGLNKVRARKLLTVLEPAPDGLPSFVVFVFTTTLEGQQTLFDGVDDAGPLLSRCVPVQLAQTGLAGTPARKGQPPKPGPFALHVHAIAEKEGLNGKPIAAYVRLLQDCKNNLRMALQRVGAGEMLERNDANQAEGQTD